MENSPYPPHSPYSLFTGFGTKRNHIAQWRSASSGWKGRVAWVLAEIVVQGWTPLILHGVAKVDKRLYVYLNIDNRVDLMNE